MDVVVMKSGIRGSSFIGELANQAHTLACAAAIANIEVYEEGGSWNGPRSRDLHDWLPSLRQMHPNIGNGAATGHSLV
jgi:adenosylmethionine-8-amino-7-oxononanoate aminotransferase